MAPRKFESPIYTPPAPSGRPRKAVRQGENGHSPGTAILKRQASGGDHGSALVIQACAPVGPRLLDLHSAAAYLGLSEWTVRDLEGHGVLTRIRIPLPNLGELRKLLFDKRDLDALIEHWKEQAADA